MIAFFVFLTILYGGMLFYLYSGLHQMKETDMVIQPEKQNFSILIPFRNEAENLPTLLKSLSQLNYNTRHFEILCIDDHSNDTSVQLIEEFKQLHPHLPLRLLQSTIPSKKAALTQGISKSQFNWIVTTDADCTVPPNWLECYNSCIQKHNYQFIAAPVTYIRDGSLLQTFQYLDFLSLQGTTMATFQKGVPFLCNGANLCFYKPSFFELNGFEGNAHIASGDDVFLLEKFVKRDRKQVHYLNSLDCLVETHPQKTWSSLFSQRIRWAAKTTAVKGIFPLTAGAIVFSTNLWILVFTAWEPKFGVLLFALKFVVDSLFLRKTSHIFKKTFDFTSMLFSAFIYPVFSVMVVIAVLTSNYTWKDRKYKK